jgi:hypothetical protein
MAQTKRKRRSSKHRGNAAGVVETRGRTGRPLTEHERKEPGKDKRVNRLDAPPTWKSSVNRALIAAALFGVMLVLLFKQEVKVALPMTALVLAVYIPLGYVTDLMIYRWREAKKQKAQA